MYTDQSRVRRYTNDVEREFPVLLQRVNNEITRVILYICSLFFFKSNFIVIDIQIFSNNNKKKFSMR